MIDKRALSGLLAMAALSMSSAMPQLPKGRASRDWDLKERARRDDFDPKTPKNILLKDKLTEEQRIWNDAVDAKKAAKKATI